MGLGGRRVGLPGCPGCWLHCVPPRSRATDDAQPHCAQALLTVGRTGFCGRGSGRAGRRPLWLRGVPATPRTGLCRPGPGLVVSVPFRAPAAPPTCRAAHLPPTCHACSPRRAPATRAHRAATSRAAHVARVLSTPLTCRAERLPRARCPHLPGARCSSAVAALTPRRPPL